MTSVLWLFALFADAIFVANRSIRLVAAFCHPGFQFFRICIHEIVLKRAGLSIFYVFFSLL